MATRESTTGTSGCALWFVIWVFAILALIAGIRDIATRNSPPQCNGEPMTPAYVCVDDSTGNQETYQQMVQDQRSENPALWISLGVIGLIGGPAVGVAMIKRDAERRRPTRS